MINLIAVDDELAAKILFEHFFRKEIEQGKINFRFAQSGKECMELLQEKSLESSLVVTDINMPDMSGVELAEKINQECPEVKIFLISAYEARSQMENIKRLNISEYISKPVDFEELKQKIFQKFSEF